MKKQVKELQGVGLDWAVALAVGAPVQIFQDRRRDRVAAAYPTLGPIDRGITPKPYAPSTDWACGGPLIDELNLEVRTIYLDRNAGRPLRAVEMWIDLPDGDARSGTGVGNNSLVAVCRAIVAARLGGEVDIPEQLGV